MTLATSPEIFDRQQLVSLVRAAQQGDRNALGPLFERFYQVVYATALRSLGNHAEAQELCQEVFCQAMRKIRQLRNPVCFGAWLRSITRRMAINRAMRRAPEVCFGAGPGTIGTMVAAGCVERETPLGEVLARERADQLRVGLSRLTALDRDTLVAFYFAGQSLVEMSDQFQSPVGTIKRRLHVARKRLAKQLGALAPA
jgi:RNA polymerase sigma-70 factor (ECF subfamily)